MGSLVLIALLAAGAWLLTRGPSAPPKGRVVRGTDPRPGARQNSRKDGPRTLDGIAVYATRRLSDDALRIWWSYTSAVDVRALRVARARKRGEPAPAEPALATGDMSFEATVYVAGDPLVGLAALDAPTRSAIVALFTTYEATLANGRLSANARGDPDTDPGHGRCEELVATVARAARDAARDPWSRLRTLLLTDPEPATRGLVVRQIADRPPDAKDHDALLEMLADPDPGVRFEVARAVGEPGLAAVRALLTDVRVDGVMRSDWLDAIVADGRLAAFAELLPALRETGDIDVRCAALRATGRSGEQEASAWLQRAARAPQAGVRAAAADGLGARLAAGDHACEPVLLAMLKDPDSAVAVAAADAIGEAASATFPPDTAPESSVSTGDAAATPTRVSRTALTSLQDAARGGTPELQAAAMLAAARVEAALRAASG